MRRLPGGCDTPVEKSSENGRLVTLGTTRALWDCPDDRDGSAGAGGAGGGDAAATDDPTLFLGEAAPDA